MDKRYSWLKFCAPIFGILFCPLTILFIWSVFSAPDNTSSNEVFENTLLLK